MDEKNLYTINNLKIDPSIFTYKFMCRCGGECCYYGVYTDFNEFKGIMEIKDKIIPLMDETQTTDVSAWFEEPEDDDDFASGIAVGTNLHNNKCVFLDKNGLCVLQRLAINEGENQWKYKPLYCILFPFTIYENTLTVDTDHMDRLKTCNKGKHKDSYIFDCCKDELIHLLGKDGFTELEKYREEYFKNNLVEN